MLMNIARLLMKKSNTSRKKYITNFVSGFTIAEILISLMISSVLVAAMVPVVGVKKVKRPTLRYHHGIAECYYQNGTLKAYNSNVGRGASPDVIRVNGSRCEFKVPQAKYLQVYAIGAGGNSGGNSIEYINTQNTNIEGEIYIGNTYQEYIDAADSKHSGLSSILREALNHWSAQKSGGLQGVYTISSPLGSGGYGKCTGAKISNASHCQTYCNDLSNAYCTGPLQSSGRFYSVSEAQGVAGSYCWAYIHGRGQNSGLGIRKTFSVKIDGDTQIKLTENSTEAGVSVLNGDSVSSLYLSASGNGNNPSGFDGNSYSTSYSTPRSSTCRASNSSYCNNTSPDPSYYSPGSDRGQEPTMGYGCSDYLTTEAKAKPGNVDYAHPTFVYKYTPVIFRVNQPAGGTPGGVESKIYEKLSGTLYLYPAKTTSSASYVRKKDASVNLLAAGSGTNGGKQATNIDVSVSSLPIVSSSRDVAKADNEKNFLDYLSKVNSFEDNGGLKNCRQSGTCPGFSGNGAYLYLQGSGLNNINTLTITNKQNNEVYTHRGDSQIHNNASNCESGDTKTYITSQSNIDLYYCKPSRTNGNSGAIIIVW